VSATVCVDCGAGFLLYCNKEFTATPRCPSCHVVSVRRAHKVRDAVNTIKDLPEDVREEILEELK